MGDWFNDCFHGKGKYLFANGDTYMGQLENGQKAGKGKYIYANENVYEGEWCNDRKHGTGCFTYTKVGEKYIGK